MKNALLLDYFGTIADPAKVDAVLKPLATSDDFKGIYINGAQKALDKIVKEDNSTQERVRGTFYSGVKDLFKKAQKSGLDTKVYSSGNGRFITKGLELIGVKTGFIDPKAVGNKKDPEAYERIRKVHGYGKIIFASDSKAEVKAALDGGVDRAVLVNPKNPSYSQVRRAIEAYAR